MSRHRMEMKTQEKLKKMFQVPGRLSRNAKCETRPKSWEQKPSHIPPLQERSSIIRRKGSFKVGNKVRGMGEFGGVKPGVFRVVVTQPMNQILSSFSAAPFINDSFDFILLLVVYKDRRRSGRSRAIRRKGRRVGIWFKA